MKYYVYLIISINNQKSTTYVGYTSNLKNRLLLHNTSKGAKFTRGRKWVLVYKKKYESKSVAMKNEYILKNDRIKRKHIKNRFLKKIK